MFRREKPYWLAVGVVAALILMVSLIGGYFDFKRMERHLNTQRTSLERRRDLVARIESAQNQGNLIRDMAAPVDTLIRIGPTVRDVMSIVAAAKHPNDWISLVCDGGSYQFKNPSVDTNKTSRFDHIIIEGFTPKLDFSTVLSLIDRLEEIKLIAAADLLSDDKLAQPDKGDIQGSDRRIKRFVIDVKVGAP